MMKKPPQPPRPDRIRSIRGSFSWIDHRFFRQGFDRGLIRLEKLLCLVPIAGVDLTVIQECLGHVSIDTACSYKAILIETKREVLQKFHLFRKSWQKTNPEGVDWNLHPNLLPFLESL
jgi:hypothetical protein